ncbi:transcriptional regulator family: Fungal Specific TF [Aspergillus niger]|nr:transcriptional regulator family: Fungal Specific TF [Aspergillus niger]
MYKPAPPRPKKTNIIRSRNGCKSCRSRRTKCDERKPKCGTCARLGKICEYARPSFKFQVTTVDDPRPPLEPLATATASNVSSEETTPTPAGDQTSAVRAAQDVPSIGSYDIIRSLQTTDRDIFYTTYWEGSCLPALHPIFKFATSLAAGHPILNDALLALSACNIGRIQAEHRTESSGSMCSLSPSLVHQTRSHLYYSSAIQKLAIMQSQDYHQDPTTILIVLVLFAHLEQAMGNFQGFYTHVRGMMNLLEWHDGVKDAATKSLLASWMQIRYVVWWARAYFSSIEVCQHLPSIPLPASLLDVPQTLHERRVKVLSIMCESHRLNFNAVLQQFRNLQSDDASGFDVDERYVYCTALLHQEAAKLDAWVLQLPPSEQPIYELSDTNGTTIRFQSHDAALNYAYYAVARAMQCTGVLQLLYSSDTPQHERECNEEEYWVQTLVRIAQWSDMQTSITKNSYTIGFSGLLLAGILRCQSLAVGLEIQDWLQALINLQPTEEGAFPIYQTFHVVKIINQQRAIGRDIFAVTQPVDDGGGTPKLTGYNSQSITSLLFHGKYQNLDCLFQECISLDV